MVTSARSLESLQIASPCPANWEEMQGDERVRHCGQCNLNVYNLAGMTRAEATRLVSEREGRVCLRMLRRADGTVITRDCPVGLRALRRRVARRVSAVVACLVAILCAPLWLVRGARASEGSPAGAVAALEARHSGLKPAWFGSNHRNGYPELVMAEDIPDFSQAMGAVILDERPVEAPPEILPLLEEAR